MATVERIPASRVGQRAIQGRFRQRQRRQGQAAQVNRPRFQKVAFTAVLLATAFASGTANAQVTGVNNTLVVRSPAQEQAFDPNFVPQLPIQVPSREGLPNPSPIVTDAQSNLSIQGDRANSSTAPVSGNANGEAPRSEESASAPIDPLSVQKLTIADVIASTVRAFPAIEQARLQAGVAAGQTLSARGFYDHKLYGHALSEALGNYENTRSGISLARQLWWGGYLAAGYRLGRGDFEPWYKERETNKGGETKLAYVQPLLQGRAIDPARVELFQANLRLQAVGPEIQREVLRTSFEAADTYWNWVALGATLSAQDELLKLAERRDEQLKQLVEAGKNKAIDLIFNDQLLAERRLKVIETRQKFRELAIKLSFFLRDEVGQPMLPAADWVPDRFPKLDRLEPGDFQQDLADASMRRPELRVIQLDIQSVNWDYRLAQNQLMPQIDIVSEASQDMGPRSTPTNDKGEFELEVGLQGEVPLQRRKARGKMQASQAKLAQLQQKFRMQQDKIGIELQVARNALDQAAQGVDQAEAALRAAIDTLDRFNYAFQQGQVDLVYINLLESKVTDYEIKLIESQQKWFAALAAMQAALGLDPIEQSISISMLPPSEAPTPSNLPAPTRNPGNPGN